MRNPYKTILYGKPYKNFYMGNHLNHSSLRKIIQKFFYYGKPIQSVLTCPFCLCKRKIVCNFFRLWFAFVVERTMATKFPLLLLVAILLPLLTQTTITPFNNNIFFLKTHKTASSTFASILKRLAVNHKSRTPLEINEYGFHTQTLPKRYQQINATLNRYLQGPPFGVWANHIRLPWGLESAQLLVPNAQQIISVVRYPPDRFASYVCYFDKECDLKIAGAPWIKPKGAAKRMGAMDLNHREIVNTTQFDIAEIVEKIANEPVEATPYRLMVMERFDESLALFSLDFDLTAFDVAYNVMKKKKRPSLNQEVRNYLEEKQPNDMALFHAAEKQLERRIQSYPRDVFEKRMEEIKTVGAAFRRYCFRTRPAVPTSEVRRVDDGEEIDWNRERTRENFAKNSLKKKFALETLQSRLLGENAAASSGKVPEELEGLDMGKYGDLRLQCFLMEMDELRWLKWTGMWMQETKGLDLTVENMLKRGLADDIPHKVLRKGGGGGGGGEVTGRGQRPVVATRGQQQQNQRITGVGGRARTKGYFSQSKLRELMKTSKKLQTRPVEGKIATPQTPQPDGETTTTTTTTATATTTTTTL